MKHNFDELVQRVGTNSMKWDFCHTRFGKEDLLPMWVADMDFKAPPAVIKAMENVAKHGIYGYAEGAEGYYSSLINWMAKRHNWSIKKEWICYSPGVIPALMWIIRTFTNPGDKVILQSPVYYPFYHSIENSGCHVVHNHLKYEDGNYVMDYDDLERKIDKRVKMLILCSPHNPVGRVWTREELVKLGEICLKHDILVVADEIHHDLVYKSYKHTVFASISSEFANNTITTVAPSKTFNLAGLQVAHIIISNDKHRRDFNNALESNGMSRANIFGIAASEAAFAYGEEWLEELLEYLLGNINFMEEFIKKDIPMVKMIKPQGTYLVWMDFRELGMDRKSLEAFLREKGNIALNQGYIFGPQGEGFARMNVACPRSIVVEGLKRIKDAISQI